MSDGFSKLLPSIITISSYIASAVFLSAALKKSPWERRIRSGRESASSAPAFWAFCFSKKLCILPISSASHGSLRGSRD
ncbi:MAG: hypothetical protein PUC44_04835 [Eubacteriales bacterium]|nr:hypothetical protein [Eubacteriales bacterium]